MLLALPGGSAAAVRLASIGDPGEQAWWIGRANRAASLMGLAPWAGVTDGVA